MNSIIPDSFVVVSDFHSYEWPLNKIEKYYLNEYDKIYILGDATDRGKENNGTGGLRILQKIKELTEKYPNRVIYIPGNHDQFVYEYMNGSFLGEANLYGNGGSKTVEDLTKLKENNLYEFEKLKNWLGNLPIQVIHKYNGKSYALAHAFFDKDVYDENPNFSLKILEDCTPRSYEGKLANILWFRKAKMPNDYRYDNLPPANTIMVIGHTPETHREGENLDLLNTDGQTIKVVCVDGGITYDGGGMLKYTGKDEAIRTEQLHHNPPDNVASTIEKDIEKQIQDNPEKLLEEVIIDIANRSNNIYYDIEDLFRNRNMEVLSEKNNLKKYVPFHLFGGGFNEILNKYYLMNGERYIKNKDTSFILKDYIDDVLLKHVVISMNKKYDSCSSVTKQLAKCLKHDDFSYITRINNARSIANKLGTKTIQDVIAINSCNLVSEYVRKIIGEEKTSS